MLLMGWCNIKISVQKQPTTMQTQSNFEVNFLGDLTDLPKNMWN
jgi:hypothetical protein